MVNVLTLGPGDPGVSLTDFLGEGSHGEVGHGASLEHDVDHLSVAHIIVTLVHTLTIGTSLQCSGQRAHL